MTADTSRSTLQADDTDRGQFGRPPLIVVGEIGLLDLGWLSAEVSTIAVLDVFFVTGWQSLSQVQHRYGALADAVLLGHRTKCLFAGIDDLATVRYLSGLLGHEHVERWTTSHEIASALSGSRNPGRRSVAQTLQREEFAPANTLRQMYPGEAVLLHGTLLPAHLGAVRWSEEPDIARLVPVRADGRPTVPENVSTCPLSDTPATDDGPPIDAATLAAALLQFPKPTRLGGDDDRDEPPAKRPVSRMQAR